LSPTIIRILNFLCRVPRIARRTSVIKHGRRNT
jgi:hypothetical protein